MSAPLEKMCIHSSERTRAYVKIEDGCDNRCAYCIVPQARGHVRSKPAEEVVEEVRGLVAAGYYEIVLTGIETACWGRDLGDENLADLLEKVDAIEGIGRDKTRLARPVADETGVCRPNSEAQSSRA